MKISDDKTFGERFTQGANAAWEGLKALTTTGDLFKAMDTVRDELKPSEVGDIVQVGEDK